jgi:nuclear transport factor 2 (NTF2) superfamily protein
MEVADPVVVVKTEPIEIVKVANVNNVTNESGVANIASVDIDNRRRSFRLERLELAKARKAITEFGKSLRKTEVIQEKEAPLAAGTENVIADTDTDMAEDVSVNTVESVNNESVPTYNTIEMAERAIAETDAAIRANQKEFVAEFGDTPVDEFDVDIEPLC